MTLQIALTRISEEVKPMEITREEYLNLPENSMVGSLEMTRLAEPYIVGKIYRVRGFEPEIGNLAPIIEVKLVDDIPQLTIKTHLIKES